VRWEREREEARERDRGKYMCVFVFSFLFDEKMEIKQREEKIWREERVDIYHRRPERRNVRVAIVAAVAEGDKRGVSTRGQSKAKARRRKRKRGKNKNNETGRHRSIRHIRE
jgi:hypothetical protein